ncbi:sugar phosphate isomerase/epimerase [Paenibacillus alginolyticus]|uniref:Sugar phosphate isomerase/epimerase n=1 Tax=Paenibacillus alginolyticus TaxID=59839 RepID=A0ABT4GN96_9BACL|nr:sugar phosphate isomerase/epimerase family protein [Paenibacillus alginolyticus]MCY9666744.1 sugar phosphate isomerase/epimerase [Paenibacillus alginolyticus]MCY9697697.1 sugar phosphate isomerase/epimerase [Paenibacillus alginolyticus]MEC0146743.1 sugar phosphate isomerase/epimerase [Paenibacillus alginolyticus]
MYKYSVTQWIYGQEELETSLKRLQKYGYDGVELAGEPELLDIEEIQSLLSEYKLECTSICGIYTAERDLTSANSDIRRRAVQYVKDCVDMAVQLGARVVIVVPTPVGKSGPETSIQEEWRLAVESLKEAGAYAESKHVVLAIEALNRFETYLVNTLTTAKKLVEEVDCPSVRIMADLFHMNIEERSHISALTDISPYLAHVHIADNTREAAGLGQTNFEHVMRTLLELQYTGAITMEFMPSVSNPYLVAAQNNESGEALLDHYTEQSIDHIKGIMNALTNE